MKRITVKELKQILSKFPDDAIVCLYSDAEGNEKSTMLDFFGEIVGKVYNEYEYSFVGGDDVYGIDLEKDKGKVLLYLQPSL